MINSLLLINADLGSSIAVRYAQALSNQIDLQVHGIHVVDPQQLESAPGSGWVRKTWENTLINTQRENMMRFLEVEKVNLPFLKVPKVAIGEKTEKIMDEIRTNEYGLFLEGVPPTTHPGDFYNLVNSRLYRMLPCPILVVKNFLPPTRAAILLDDPSDLTLLPESVFDLFKGKGIEAVPIFPKFSASGPLKVQPADPGTLPESPFVPRLSGEAKILEGTPRLMAENLKAFGMVVALMRHASHKTDAMFELLGRVPLPVLICR